MWQKLRSAAFSRIVAVLAVVTVLLSSVNVFSGLFASAEDYAEIWDGSADTAFDGSGTQADPYRITSAAELYGFFKKACAEGVSANYSEAWYELTTDVYLNNVADSNWMNGAARDWVSLNIWTANNNVTGFRGHFDGKGHTVYGLYYSNPNDWAAFMGLIPIASGNAVITDVNIRNAYVKPSSYQSYFGIVGFVNKNSNGTASNVTISKCVADNTIDLSGLNNSYAAGICGTVRESYLTVQYCGSAAKFGNENSPAGKGGSIVGHVGGWAAKGLTVINSYCTAAFTTGIGSIPAAAISDGTLYSVQTWWKSTGGVNLTGVSASNILGAAAKTGMPDLGWDVWRINQNSNGYPVIAGSTADGNIALKPVEGGSSESEGGYDDSEPGKIWTGKASKAFAGGTGTKKDPYLIRTAEQLYRMVSQHCLAVDPNPGTYYKLDADIYLNDVSDAEWYKKPGVKQWYSINLTDTNTGFKGIFNGDGHTVYGIYYKDLWVKGGLIPVVGGNGSITNVNVRKSYLSGINTGNCYLGGITGYVQSGSAYKISMCSVRDTVFGPAAAVGGIVGGVSAGNVDISDCYFVGSDFSHGANYEGGIYGDSWGYTAVQNCYVVGRVAIDKTHPVANAVRYTTVPQSEARDIVAQKTSFTVVSEDDIKGENAKKAMPGFDWDLTWIPVENDFPRINPLAASMSTDGVVGGVWSGKAAEDYAGGTGTEDDPYQIATGEQLYKMVKEHAVENDSPSWFVLTEDIRLNDTSAEKWYEGEKVRQWYYTYGPNNAFSGHLDGQGHVVSGLYIKTNSANVRGALIPGLDANASVKNVGVTQSYVDVSVVNNEVYGAALVAYIKYWVEYQEKKEENYPVISGCFADTSVTVKGLHAGGIVSGIPAPVIIKDCYYVGKIIGGERFGAVIGNTWSSGSIIETSYACTPDFDQIAGGKSDSISDGIEFRDAYIFGTSIGHGLKFVGIDDMIGEKAKTGMPALDYENVWMTVEGSTPILKIFSPRVTESTNEKNRYSTVSFVTNVEGLTIDPVTAEIGAPLTLPTPTREGYRLEGWYVYPEFQCLFTDHTFPYRNLTLYANWAEDSIIQNFEFYTNTEYDLGEDMEFYRPGVANYAANNVHGGSKAIHRKGETAADSEFLLNYEDQLTVGAEYKMSFWAMTDTENPKGELSVLFKNWPDVLETNNGMAPVISLDGIQLGEWKQYSCSFIAKSPWISILTPGNTSIYFDDFMLVRTSDAIHDVPQPKNNQKPDPVTEKLPADNGTTYVPTVPTIIVTEEEKPEITPEPEEKVPPTEQTVTEKKETVKEQKTEPTEERSWRWIIPAAVAVLLAVGLLILLLIRKKKKSGNR